MVGCYLYDVQLGSSWAGRAMSCSPGDWRRAAHKCADMVYSRLSGESPFFDSRIAYIAETGPKDHRMKRLAIMERRCQPPLHHHRQAMALTPRFSPDYRKIVYLSYLNGARASMSMTSAPASSGWWRRAQSHLRAALVARWQVDPLFDGHRRQHEHLPRLGAGRASQQLTNTPGINVGGSYSPDGSKIVFESDRRQPADLCDECRRQQPAPHQLLRRPRGHARMEPARRPDRLHPHRGQSCALR
jgi:TolB protein